ncbi:MAG TPA: hypothetical protein PLJ48_10845, partial [Dermatophilaceae bacterium]|nr:hypothetical protein [Dermatophilaceae bacterium]
HFNTELIKASKEDAGCYKVQIAYYEAMGLDGLITYKKTLDTLRSLDIQPYDMHRYCLPSCGFEVFRHRLATAEYLDPAQRQPRK